MVSVLSKWLVGAILLLGVAEHFRTTGQTGPFAVAALVGALFLYITFRRGWRHALGR